jgi:hypothetical protein
VLQAVPAGQSVAWVQPHAPVTQAVPVGLAVQLRQLPPATPHAAGAVPEMHVAPSQHPSLHAVWLASPHATSQVKVVRLHEVCVGQSLAVSQPQVVPPRHRWPAALPVQSTQSAPVAPQASAAVPSPQVASARQQPPLHGEWPLPQAASQCGGYSQLHEVPAGQSAAPKQRHWPFSQTWPPALWVQSTQSPKVPQAEG